jgi:hypothetical protein
MRQFYIRIICCKSAFRRSSDATLKRDNHHNTAAIQRLHHDICWINTFADRAVST